MALLLASVLGLRSCTEPWSRCSPDAFWLRRVLAQVGFAHPGQTGSALIIPRQRFVWATPGTGVDPVYRVVSRVGGRRIYGDGVRVSWIVQKRQVWVEPPPPRRLLVPLVQASSTVKR